MPQCLCWTDWEIHHRCERWLLGDGCRRDKWVTIGDKVNKKKRTKHIAMFARAASKLVQQ